MDAARSTASKRIKTCPLLPEEIVEDILSRLPAKSLRRFQCVSRWFHATVASPVFQEAHYQRNKGKRSFFIKPLSMYRKPLYTLQWQPNNNSGRRPAVLEEIMSSSHLPQGSIFPVATKSCRGLLLLSCLEYHTHYVWNPSTREMLTLPDNPPLRAARRAASPRTSRRPLVSYGLGYCSATQRHKVVRMYCVGDYHGPPATVVCEVFTLAESACWRPVDTTPQQRYPRENWRQGSVFCNGNLYFLQAGGDITTFNVSGETFGMLLKPPPELQSSSNFEITELGGCLCVYTFTEWWGLLYQLEEPAKTCAIWLLRETGGWEKICSIDWRSMLQSEHAHLITTLSWIGPLDMYSDGNNQMKITFATGHSNVFTVDPSSTRSVDILFSPEEHTTIIGAVGECHNDQLPIVGLFEESLAWVGNAAESERNLFSSPSVQAWSEVLSRLPSRTVGSLSQVCRGWRAMIKSARFLAAHLCNANVHKSPEIMFFGVDPYGLTPVKDFIVNSTRNVHDVPPLIDEGSNVVCSKPCHGLNGGSFPYFDFVRNPVTGYFKALPLRRSRDLTGLSLYEFLRKVPLHVGQPMLAGRLGLGYEKETSRHVLVRLECKGSSMMTRHDYSRLECKMRYVEDMFWVEVDPPPRPIGCKAPAYANGKLYWMADTEPEQMKLQGHQEIVVLDISMRKFEVVQGPPCSHDHMSIFELQQVICVACSSHQSTDSVLLIWAMDDKGSWFAKYHIELGRHWPEYSPELVTPLAVHPVDGRILLSTGRALGYYDPITTELETIYRLGKHIIGKKFLPVLFQESLINPQDPVF